MFSPWLVGWLHIEVDKASLDQRETLVPVLQSHANIVHYGERHVLVKYDMHFTVNDRPDVIVGDRIDICYEPGMFI